MPSYQQVELYFHIVSQINPSFSKLLPVSYFDVPIWKLANRGGVLHVIQVQQSVKRESHIHWDHWLLTLSFGQSRIVVHILIAGMIFSTSIMQYILTGIKQYVSLKALCLLVVAVPRTLVIWLY